MHRGPTIEAPPPRPEHSTSHWVEISAWILAFAVLLAAQCLPDRVASEVASVTGAVSTQRVDARRR